MGYNGATAIRISTMVSGGTPKREQVLLGGENEWPGALSMAGKA